MVAWFAAIQAKTKDEDLKKRPAFFYGGFKGGIWKAIAGLMLSEI